MTLAMRSCRVHQVSNVRHFLSRSRISNLGLFGELHHFDSCLADQRLRRYKEITESRRDVESLRTDVEVKFVKSWI